MAYGDRGEGGLWLLLPLNQLDSKGLNHHVVGLNRIDKGWKQF